MGGLQNLWQTGLVFPLNLLATAYFTLNARFRARTVLDQLIIAYLIAGLASLLSGMALAVADGIADGILMVNALKSFVVFLGLLVYFGVRNVSVEELFSLSMWVFGLTSIGVMINYAYIFMNDPIALTQARSAIKWLPGWPQRWVMFPLIAHFVFLSRFDTTRRWGYLLLSAISFAAVGLSGTRSAIIGLVAGHLVLSCLGKRDFVRSLVVLAVIGVVVGVYFEQFLAAYRFQEVAEVDNNYQGSSVQYRLQNVWPGIIDSLGAARMPFGWGHVGAAYIPHRFFPDTSIMSDVPGEELGSAEGQYMDVLQRQGVVGVALYLGVLFCGLWYSYRLFKLEHDAERRALWKAACAWQVGIMLHGVTVETVRFTIYSLFFFIFLGIASLEYERLRPKRVPRQAVQAVAVS